jgi:hypothetical protein
MSTPNSETSPSDATTAEEGREAASKHDADRPPTDEELAAIKGDGVDKEVADSYKDAMERGANVKGEGQID